MLAQNFSGYIFVHSSEMTYLKNLTVLWQTCWSITAHADQINGFVFIAFSLCLSLSGRGEQFVEASPLVLCVVPKLSFSETQSCQKPGSSQSHTHRLHIYFIK